MNRVYGIDQKDEVKEKILEVEKGREEDKGEPDEEWTKNTILELEKKGHLTTEEIEKIKEVPEEYRDVFVPTGVKLPAMQGEKMEIRLVDGGDKKLKQSRGYPLGEVDSLVLKHKLKERMRIGVVKNGIAGEGPLNVSPAFMAPKRGQLLERMVADYKHINGIADKTVWKGAIHNFAHLEGREPRKFYSQVMRRQDLFK